jgi:hypothetical protein
MSIRFLDFTFTEPALFHTASKPGCGGLYAVMVFDASCSPRPYRVIYFGKARDLSERPSTSHENYRSWLRASAGSPLYVAFCRIDLPLLRGAIERRIIAHYQPACNETFNPAFTTLSTLRGVRINQLG